MTYRELYDNLKTEYEKLIASGKHNLTSESIQTQSQSSSLTFKKDSDYLNALSDLLELAEKEEADAAATAQGVKPSNYMARVYFYA